MNILDAVKEEQRRKAAGLAPACPPPVLSRGWLRRAGYEQRSRIAAVLSIMPLPAGVLWLVSLRAEAVSWLRQLVLGAFLLSSLAYLLAGALRWTIRCRVCGQRLPSYSGARRLGAEKWAWLDALESCPVCGDAGQAGLGSRRAWELSGQPLETPYWSGWRLAAAIVLSLVFVLGGAYYGASQSAGPQNNQVHLTRSAR